MMSKTLHYSKFNSILKRTYQFYVSQLSHGIERA